jgi:hypothetical protein
MGEKHKIWIKDMEENQDKPSWRLLEDVYDQYLPDRYKKATEEQQKAGHGGGDFYITQDFIDAIKNGTEIIGNLTRVKVVKNKVLHHLNRLKLI